MKYMIVALLCMPTVFFAQKDVLYGRLGIGGHTILNHSGNSGYMTYAGLEATTYVSGKNGITFGLGWMYRNYKASGVHGFRANLSYGGMGSVPWAIGGYMQLYGADTKMEVGSLARVGVKLNQTVFSLEVLNSFKDIKFITCSISIAQQLYAK